MKNLIKIHTYIICVLIGTLPMKNLTNMEEVFYRLQQGASVKSLTDLARALGVAQQSVFNARARGKIPDAWFRKIADLNNISIDWLTYGEGPMHRNMQEQLAPTPEPQSTKALPPTVLCRDCGELKKELAAERSGWRELVTENRQLWKEIAELREYSARLEERAGQESKKGGASTVVQRPASHAHLSGLYNKE